MPETAIIKKLKDGSENVVLPVTHERAVRDDSGTTLETKLQDIISTATSNLAESKSYTDTLNSAMNTRVSTNSQDIETLKSDVLELQTGLGTQETKESTLEDTVDEDKLKEQEKQPDEEIEIRDGNTYKVFSSSKILNRSLRLLSETDPTVFPILVKLKKEVRESKKTGNKYTIYDIEVE